MTGAKLGQFDLSWLIRCVRLDLDARILYLSPKGLPAAEAYILARHHMYNAVYFHKTTRSAEVMLRALLGASKVFLSSGKGFGQLAPGAPIVVENAILGSLDLSLYLQLDEGSAWEFIKCACQSEDPTVQLLSQGLLNRKFLKPLQLQPEQGMITKLTEFVTSAKALIDSMGFDSNFLFQEDRPANEPFKVYDPVTDSKVRNIYVEHKRKPEPLQKVSEAVRALTAYSTTRFYVPEKCLTGVEKILEQVYS